MARFGSGLSTLGALEQPRLAIDFMEMERSFHSLPEVMVANWDDPSETFPLPIILTPLADTAPNASAYVPASGNQRYSRGALKCLQATDDSQQFETFPADISGL